MKFYKKIEKRTGSDYLTLFLTGYTGGSGAFSAIFPFFSSDILTLTYPGHGESYREFNSTGAEDWERSVIETIEAEERRYKEILIVGYSMGGALALLYGKNHPKILLAPAVIAKEENSGSPVDSSPITLDNVNPRLKAMCDEEDFEALSWFLVEDGPKSKAELSIIENKANALECNFEDTIAFIGEKDPVIPFNDSYPWLKLHGIETLSFKESTHAILYDDASEVAVASIKKTLLTSSVYAPFC